MHNSCKNYKQLSPFPIFVKISSSGVSKISISTPFSESDDLKKYVFPIKTLFKKLFPNIQYINITVLTNSAKFVDIFEFILKCMNDFTMRDEHFVRIVENENEFSACIKDEIVFSQKYFS